MNDKNKKKCKIAMIAALYFATIYQHFELSQYQPKLIKTYSGVKKPKTEMLLPCESLLSLCLRDIFYPD